MSKMVKLGDLCIKITDGSHYSPHGVDKGYPMLSAKDMEEYDFNFSQCKYISESDYKNMLANDCKPLINDVLIIKDGSYLQKVFVIKEERECAILSSIGILRPNILKLNPYYLKYYLSSEFVKKEVAKKYVTGSVLPRIILKNFANIDVPYIDVTLQEKAVSILRSIDSKIENNNKINTELESMAKTIYDYWFLQYEFPNEEGKPYKSSGGKMVWNEELKREVPEGWRVDLLGNLFTSNRGISYNSKTLEGQGVPMINLASFNVDGSYKEDGIKTYSGQYAEDKVVKPFDLLMCNTQQTAIDYKKDIIGKAFLVPDIFGGDVVTSHHITTIQVKNSNMKYFLHRLFNTNYFHKYVAGFTNGTNILGLIFNGIERYKTDIPSETVLNKFAALMLDVEMRKSKIIKENQELISLRDFLLPLLMNGQVGFKD